MLWLLALRPGKIRLPDVGKVEALLERGAVAEGRRRALVSSLQQLIAGNGRTVRSRYPP